MELPPQVQRHRLRQMPLDQYLRHSQQLQAALVALRLDPLLLRCLQCLVLRLVTMRHRLARRLHSVNHSRIQRFRRPLRQVKTGIPLGRPLRSLQLQGLGPQRQVAFSSQEARMRRLLRRLEQPILSPLLLPLVLLDNRRRMRLNLLVSVQTLPCQRIRLGHPPQRLLLRQQPRRREAAAVSTLGKQMLNPVGESSELSDLFARPRASLPGYQIDLWCNLPSIRSTSCFDARCNNSNALQ